MIKSIIVCLCIIVLCSCAQTEFRPIIEQQSLLQKCTYETPTITNFTLDENGKKVYSGKEMMRALFEWQDVYNVCATQHDALVDTIINLEKERAIKKG